MICIVNPIKGVANKTSTLSECWHISYNTRNEEERGGGCGRESDKTETNKKKKNKPRDKQTATNIHHFDFVEMPPSISAQSDKQKRRYLNNNAFCRYLYTLTLSTPCHPSIVHSIYLLYSTSADRVWGKISIEQERKKCEIVRWQNK